MSISEFLHKMCKKRHLKVSDADKRWFERLVPAMSPQGTKPCDIMYEQWGWDIAFEDEECEARYIYHKDSETLTIATEFFPQWIGREADIRQRSAIFMNAMESISSSISVDQKIWETCVSYVLTLRREDVTGQMLRSIHTAIVEMKRTDFKETVYVKSPQDETGCIYYIEINGCVERFICECPDGEIRNYDLTYDEGNPFYGVDTWERYNDIYQKMYRYAQVEEALRHPSTREEFLAKWDMGKEIE